MVKRTDLNDETTHRTKQRIELNEQTYMKHTELNEYQWWATHSSSRFFPSLVLSFSSLCCSLFLQFCFLQFCFLLFCFLLPLSLFFSPVNTHSVSSLHVPIPHSVMFHPPRANSNSLSSLFLHVPNTITKLSTLGLPRGRQKFSPLLACHVASIFIYF